MKSPLDIGCPFIIKTKEVLNTTQTATYQIVNDVSEMLRNTLSQVATKVLSVLAAHIFLLVM